MAYGMGSLTSAPFRLFDPAIDGAYQPEPAPKRFRRGVLDQDAPVEGYQPSMRRPGILDVPEIVTPVREEEPPRDRPILRWLNENQGALAGMSAGFLTGRGGFGQAMAGFQSGGEYDAKRRSEKEAAAERKRKLEAVQRWAESRIASGTLTPADAQMIQAYPELADKFFGPQQGQDRWEPATINGMQGQRNLTTGKFDPFPQPAPSTNFDDEAKLRKEYIDASQAFVAVRDGYSRLQAAAIDETGASDIALVYGFMKMLDPTSVVREGEFATAEQAGGVPAQIVSLYNKLINGERLAPNVRSEFLQQGQRQYEAAQARQNALEEQYRGLSQQYQFDPARITPDMGGGVRVGAPQGASQAIDAARRAIQQGADPEAVKRRLRENGIDPAGL